MIPELKEMTYEKRLAQLGLWTLEERRNRADVSYCIQERTHNNERDKEWSFHGLMFYRPDGRSASW